MSVAKPSPAFFHKLYGKGKPKVTYYGSDFLDYVMMILLCILVIKFSFGPATIISMIGFALCVFMLAVFVIRHGIELRVPVMLRKPQEVFYMFVYKLQNVRSVYFATLVLLLLENLLIALTPDLPHHVELMRKLAFYLFYVHFVFLTGFRTVIFIAHLLKKDLVREVLMQTPWRRVIRDKTNISLEIVHAYCTGILTHIISIAPWYLVIRYLRFSVIFLPVVCLINIITQLKWYKVFNAWFYRDHWLGHNSEFEFIYLHGAHHDAIPSGMVAVAENGLLEGFMRFVIGAPVSFYNPIVSFMIFTLDVKTDIELHQYIPGIFPRLSREQMAGAQHSTHHYGPLEPYSLGSKELDTEILQKNGDGGLSTSGERKLRRIPDEIRNSIKLDEELTGFRWDNPTYRRTLRLWDKYQS